MTIKIIQKGSNRGQGVGYLDDGTMVVIEQGYALLGHLVEVEVDRMHNTVSGKMIFAKLINAPKPAGLKPEPRKNKPFRKQAPKKTTPEPKDEGFVSDLRRELR
jgi:hypothetical protein